MKYIIKRGIELSILLVLMICIACNNEDNGVENITEPPYSVPMKLTADVGSDASSTRAYAESLTSIMFYNGSKFYDALWIESSDGNWKGVLMIEDGEPSSSASFSGDINWVGTGTPPSVIPSATIFTATLITYKELTGGGKPNVTYMVNSLTDCFARAESGSLVLKDWCVPTTTQPYDFYYPAYDDNSKMEKVASSLSEAVRQFGYYKADFTYGSIGTGSIKLKQQNAFATIYKKGNFSSSRDYIMLVSETGDKYAVRYSDVSLSNFFILPVGITVKSAIIAWGMPDVNTDFTIQPNKVYTLTIQ